jgi:hypothetical protein
MTKHDIKHTLEGVGRLPADATTVDGPVGFAATFPTEKGARKKLALRERLRVATYLEEPITLTPEEVRVVNDMIAWTELALNRMPVDDAAEGGAVLSALYEDEQ